MSTEPRNLDRLPHGTRYVVISGHAFDIKHLTGDTRGDLYLYVQSSGGRRPMEIHTK